MCRGDRRTMGPYFWIWRCQSRALARSVAAILDNSQYRMKPTTRRKPMGTAAKACTWHAQSLEPAWASLLSMAHQGDAEQELWLNSPHPHSCPVKAWHT